MTPPLAPPRIPTLEELREALRGVIDPEAGINIVELGLVYGLSIDDGVVCVRITMTSPACPMGEMILDDAEYKLRRILPAGMKPDIQLVWSPPWEPSMMSDEARRHFSW